MSRRQHCSATRLLSLVATAAALAGCAEAGMIARRGIVEVGLAGLEAYQRSELLAANAVVKVLKAFAERTRLHEATTTGGTVSYEYEPEGLRRSRKFDGKETAYQWGTEGVQSEQLGTETPLQYSGLGPMAAFTSDARVLRDALGSPVATVGASATQRWRYDAWGEYREEPGHTLPASSETLSYTGHQWDSAPELIYAQQRWYDPKIGRFVSRDPAEVMPAATSATNPYVYGAANPTAFVDPTGAIPVPLLLVAGKALVGVAIAGATTCVADAHESGTWRGCGAAFRSAGIGAVTDGVIQAGFSLTPLGRALKSVKMVHQVMARTGIAVVAGAASNTLVALHDDQDPAKAAMIGAFWGGVGGLAMEGLTAGARAYGAKGLAPHAAPPEPDVLLSDMVSRARGQRAESVLDGAGIRPTVDAIDIDASSATGLSRALPDTGATLRIGRPSILASPTLAAAERDLIEQHLVRKMRALRSAARRGELTYSPGTAEVRMKQLQEAYRERVASRFERMYGIQPDLGRLDADHFVDLIVGGSATQRLRMLHLSVNRSIGASLRQAARAARLSPGDPIRDVILME